MTNHEILNVNFGSINPDPVNQSNPLLRSMKKFFEDFNFARILTKNRFCLELAFHP